MQRVGEDFGVIVSFDPKPVPGDWSGSGCHVTFSTKKMRENENGYDEILLAIQKLGKKHKEHMAFYGKGNECRFSGTHEHQTPKLDKFCYGVAHPNVSVSIPRATKQRGRGYLEDCRPAANMDPYVVTGKILETTCCRSNDKKSDVGSSAESERAKPSTLGTGTGTVTVPTTEEKQSSLGA